MGESRTRPARLRIGLGLTALIGCESYAGDVRGVLPDAGAAEDAAVPREDTAALPREDAAAPLDVPTSACTPGDWCWEHPLPQGNPVTDAFVVSAREAWAVAHVGTILHYGDGVWSRVPSPARVDFDRVWGTGPQDVWMWGPRDVGVGDARPRALVHWDGAALHEVPLDADAFVWGFAGSAAGVWMWGSFAGRAKPAFIRRWNGRAFEPGPSLPDGYALTDVCVRSPTDAWLMLAWREARPPFNRSIWRWDGTRLLPAYVREPDEFACPSPDTAVFRDIGTGRWQVLGFDASGDGRFTYGASVPDPSPYTEHQLVRTAHATPYLVTADTGYRWTSRGWVPAFATGDLGLPARIRFDFDEAGRAGWLVTGGPLPTPWAEGAWARPVPRGGPGLRRFVGPRGGEPTAVFGDGVVARRDGDRWRVRELFATKGVPGLRVDAAWAADGSGAWLVGDGALARWSSGDDAVTPARVETSMSIGEVVDVDGADAATVWAVGARGTVLVLNGDRWVSAPGLPAEIGGAAISQLHFRAVDVRSAGDVLLAARVDVAAPPEAPNALLVHFDASGWRAEPLDEAVTCLARTRSGTVYAAHRNIVRARLSGTRVWQERGFPGAVIDLYVTPDDSVEVLIDAPDAPGPFALDGPTLDPRAVAPRLPMSDAAGAYAGGGRHWVAGANLSIVSFAPR